MSTSAAVTSKITGKKIISTEVRDGIAIVTIDDPSETLNTITHGFGDEFAAALERIEKDPEIKGAIITSGKKDFVVGANIEMLTSIKLAADAERMSRALAKGLARIKHLKKPVIAAINGQALGGGFELALACHAIVATDDKKTQLGLPEVQLGLLPGANGLLRVAERAGLQTALDLGLTGKNTRAAKAKKLGLIDEVCPTPVLLEVATKMVRDRIANGFAPAKKHGGFVADLTTFALEKNPAGRKLLFKKAREATRKKTRGHYPATERIIDILETFGNRGFDAAAE